MIDAKTQRSAWGVAGKESPITETGISNLTKDETPALLHFARRPDSAMAVGEAERTER